MRSDKTGPSANDLGRYIEDVEESLNSESWAFRAFSDLDEKLMPYLVEMANSRKPGLNLSYLSEPILIVEKLREAIDSRVESERYIVNLGERGTHFSALDYRLIDGISSLLMFEPANFNSLAVSLLAFRLKSILDRVDFFHVKFSIFEMDIQRSGAECGIFSLALAKKLHKESAAIIELHRLNLAGEISVGDLYAAKNEIDKFLPPSLYKHAQSSFRIADYIKSNPGSDKVSVNKKGETLLERRNAHVRSIEGRYMIDSIHQKRLIELKRLREAFENVKITAVQNIQTARAASLPPLDYPARQQRHCSISHLAKASSFPRDTVTESST
ncbi:MULTISPECIES: YopJ/AvrA family T3SS effector serine/threonine acetyltransferase [Burkholderia]|uniref:YopJ/AvrA family T3SS effector serine/threonine acetyltransferase n=1 Tax=Burkholderia TaxID=32008 RepID=UPI0009BE2184|nr:MULTISPECIES: YopJ/AvrA family T3SS effector serine/threonine acetyltransferase [Burkholderia]AYZ95766.1 Effector protein YopJ [Burkholderia dolosa]MCC5031052.1 hypothetical protein [Burkholderia dolosa]PRE51998.1 Effector protein YopJ [Burkholderia sp. AU12872]PUA76301.1 Effector protein YopJ [Burkholderia sp. AU29985]UEB56030.1 hypothetical protein LK423_28470 [Burkholderia dolosa]